MAPTIPIELTQVMSDESGQGWTRIYINVTASTLEELSRNLLFEVNRRISNTHVRLCHANLPSWGVDNTHGLDCCMPLCGSAEVLSYPTIKAYVPVNPDNASAMAVGDRAHRGALATLHLLESLVHETLAATEAEHVQGNASAALVALGILLTATKA